MGIFCFSQNCQNKLSGKITDFHDNSPLAGAVVIVVGPEKTVMTDLDGNFAIEGLCDGTYRLQISHPECLARVVFVKMDGDVFEEIKLEHHVEELHSVVVEGHVFGNSLKSATENHLSEEELARHSGGSLGDALKEISGVSSLNTGNAIAKPVIHGLYGSRVLIMNHGTRMEGPDWGAEHAPGIDINSAGSVSVIKGAAALQYGGDAVGGIVKMEPPRIPKKDSLFGRAIFTGASNGRGAGLTSSLTKSYKNGWYASLQGTLKRFGDFEAPDYVLSNTGFSEQAVSARFGFDKYLYGLEGYYSFFKNEIGILAASHLGGIEDQIRALESEKPLIIRDFSYEIDAPRQETAHHLAKLKFFKRFENLGKLSVQYDFQQNHRLEFDRRRNEAENDRPSIDLTLKTHHASADLEYENRNLEAKFGFSGQYQTNYTDPKTGVKRLILDYEQYAFAAYSLASMEIDDDFILEAGLRYDFSHVDAYKYYAASLWEEEGYAEEFPGFFVSDMGTQILTNPKFTFHGFSAVAGMHYGLNDDLDLLVNYSLASRFPNPSELFSEGLHHSAARIEVGDLRFGKEVANKFSITLKKQGEKFGFSISPYLNSVSDFIYLKPVGIRQTIRGSFQVWEYRQTDALLLGVDLDASMKLSENFGFEHRFSLVKGKNRETDEALINIPPANTVNGIVYENPKTANLCFELESKYVFRQNEFPDNRFEVFVPISQSTETVDLSTPPEAYHIMAFRAGIDLAKTENYLFRLGLSVENLFDNSYRDYLNRHRYYADNLGRNIKLRLNINF
jgi:iron complex outermembrane receptor protein